MHFKSLVLKNNTYFHWISVTTFSMFIYLECYYSSWIQLFIFLVQQIQFFQYSCSVNLVLYGNEIYRFYKLLEYHYPQLLIITLFYLQRKGQLCQEIVSQYLSIYSTVVLNRLCDINRLKRGRSLKDKLARYICFWKLDRLSRRLALVYRGSSNPLTIKLQPSSLNAGGWARTLVSQPIAREIPDNAVLLIWNTLRLNHVVKVT